MIISIVDTKRMYRDRLRRLTCKFLGTLLSHHVYLLNIISLYDNLVPTTCISRYHAKKGSNHYISLDISVY